MREFTSIVQEQSLIKPSLMTMIYEHTLPMSPSRFVVSGNVHSRLEKVNVWDDFSVLHAFDGFFKELYLTGSRYMVQCEKDNWECRLGAVHHEVWHMVTCSDSKNDTKSLSCRSWWGAGSQAQRWIGSLSGVGNGPISLNCDL